QAAERLGVRADAQRSDAVERRLTRAADRARRPGVFASVRHGPRTSKLFPYTTLFRSRRCRVKISCTAANSKRPTRGLLAIEGRGTGGNTAGARTRDVAGGSEAMGAIQRKCRAGSQREVTRVRTATLE